MPDAAHAHGETEVVPQPRPRIRPLIWWFGLGAIALAAAWLSLIAYDQGLPFDELSHFDKVVHFSIGGGLAFFLDGVLKRRALRFGPAPLPLAGIFILVPAGIEEFLQRYSVHRSSDLGDFAADVAGVVVGIWLSRRIG